MVFLLCNRFDLKRFVLSLSRISMAKDEEALLVESSIPLNHTRDVHILSWAFLLIFLAYGAAQNLESTINTVSIT